VVVNLMLKIYVDPITNAEKQIDDANK